MLERCLIHASHAVFTHMMPRCIQLGTILRSRHVLTFYSRLRAAMTKQMSACTCTTALSGVTLIM